MREGRIVRQTGGFYYVDCGGEVFSCRARGLFRKEGVTPLVGDLVRMEETEPGCGFVVEILPRRNSLIRPPVANVDLLLLILSIADPAPNLTVVDKLLAIAEYKEIDVSIVVTKSDLADPSGLCRIYREAGYPVTALNSLADSPDAIREMIRGKLCVLAGNTGVGKSTLLNAMEPSLTLRTGETSRKLGRGRHTTRVTELFELAGGMIADTPGFSALETAQFERIRKEELELCFREFEPYRTGCRFTGCSHTKEKGCGVLAAVEREEISLSRHKSYCEMYEEARQIKDWEVVG